MCNFSLALVAQFAVYTVAPFNTARNGDLPFKSYEKESVLIKQVSPVGPSNRCTITLLTAASLLSLRLSVLARHLLFLSSSLPLFILALYPPSLPRAYRGARLKIDPVTAIGDILKSLSGRAARARASGRASERTAEKRTGELAPLRTGDLSAGGASSKRHFVFRPLDSSAADPPVPRAAVLRRGSVGTSPKYSFREE